MGTVFVDMVMPLDGFVAGPNNDDGGLHDWYFAPSGNAVGMIDELLTSIGAMIIGRRSSGDQPDGFDTPYKVPHFVLTHTPRQTVTNGDVPSTPEAHTLLASYERNANRIDPITDEFLRDLQDIEALTRWADAQGAARMTLEVNW